MKMNETLITIIGVIFILIFCTILVLIGYHVSGRNYSSTDIDALMAREMYHDSIISDKDNTIGKMRKQIEYLEKINTANSETMGSLRNFIRSTWDFELLARLVESEAGNQSLEIKRKVASVVINRVISERFMDQNNILDVITAPQQFTPIISGSVYDTEPSQDSYRAVMDAMLQDYADGALFFMTPEVAKHKEWFKTLLLVYEGKDMSFFKFGDY